MTDTFCYLFTSWNWQLLSRCCFAIRCSSHNVSLAVWGGCDSSCDFSEGWSSLISGELGPGWCRYDRDGQWHQNASLLRSVLLATDLRTPGGAIPARTPELAPRRGRIMRRHYRMGRVWWRHRRAPPRVGGSNEALPCAPSPSMQPAGQLLHAIPPARPGPAHWLRGRWEPTRSASTTRARSATSLDSQHGVVVMETWRQCIRSIWQTNKKCQLVFFCTLGISHWSSLVQNRLWCVAYPLPFH